MRRRAWPALLALSLPSCGGGSDATAASPTGAAGGGGDASADFSAPDAFDDVAETGSPDAGADAEDEPSEPPLSHVTFTPAAGEILNPERGFYDDVDLVSTDDFAWVRAAGRTLAYAHVLLDPTADAIPASLLSDVTAGFARVRASGFKVILRFAYNDCACGDSPKARVLGHVSQLAALLSANADVVAVVQAGFIGQWGEWHDSTSGLDNPTDRLAILSALLAALPASRMTQIRTPMFKSDAYGAALASAEAFSGTDKARVGHHDDCFLASDDDEGTYATPIDAWKSYVAADGRFTPVGGETCANNPPRSDCATATQELRELHWSFVNALYHPDVLAGWQSGGCRDEIRDKIGYRIVLLDADYPARVRPGGVVRVSLHLRNDGWASPFNARPLYLVLDDGTARQSARVDAFDVRRLESGAEVTLAVRARLPASQAPGTYRLAAWLPDDAPSIAADPAYALAFASEGVFQAAEGYNLVASDLVVDPTAGGEVDPGATAFVVVP